MDRPIAIVGAPSNIGLPPYDDGEARHVDWTPRVLRGRDLVRRVGAIDLGDVIPPPYRDFVRTPAQARNHRQIVSYSRALGRRVALASQHGRFSIVIGGDCSIVLGSLLGTHRAVNGAIGLVYLDAHADFSTPGESATGSVAGMALTIATGRTAARLGRGPALTSALVHDRDVVLLGRRDEDDFRLADSDILDLSHSRMAAMASQDVLSSVLARVASTQTAGFCIHVDVDVLDPSVMPAVGSPVPNGVSIDQLVRLLAPLVAHPKALSISVGGYDPALDPDRSCARQLVNLLEVLFAPEDRLKRPAVGAAMSSTAVSTA